MKVIDKSINVFIGNVTIWIVRISIFGGFYLFNHNNFLQRINSDVEYKTVAKMSDNSQENNYHSSPEHNSTYIMESSKQRHTNIIPDVQSDCNGFSKEQAYITLRNMSVRKEPISYSESAILANVPMGTFFCSNKYNYFTVEGEKAKWLHAKYLYSDDSLWGTGWIKGTSKYFHKVKCLYVGAKTLNYRSEPQGDKMGALRGKFVLGDKVCTLDKKNLNNTTWYMVESNNEIGWVNSLYLLKDRVDLVSGLANSDTKTLKRRIAEYNNNNSTPSSSRSNNLLVTSKCMYIGAKTLNFRAKPINGKIIDQLNLGEKVCLLEKKSRRKEWIQVTVEGKGSGWVHSSYLLKNRIDLTEGLNDGDFSEIKRRIKEHNKAL